MRKQALIWGIFCLAVAAHSQLLFQNTYRFPNLDFHNNFRWNQDPSLIAEERISVDDDGSSNVGHDTGERDREPLSPNYKDPMKTSGSEEKPILKEKKPSFNPSVLPGGIVDVDAINFPSSIIPPSGFPSEADFGFSSIGGGIGDDGGTRYPGGLFGLGGFFGALPESKPWWKGPNVCIEREETTDDDDEDEDDMVGSQKNNETEEVEKVPNFFSTAISLSNCHQSQTKYECITKINNHGVVKTFTVRYKCCYGFARTKDTAGCEKQLELKSLMETIENLGAKEFENLIKTTGLDDMMTKSNLTIFVPSDIALNDFSDKMLELNNVDLRVDTVHRRRRDLKNALSSNDLVLSHVIDGFVDLSDLANEDLLYSKNHNNGTIRINTYPTQNYERMVTANCAKITKSNNLAKNGIVHLMEGVAAPATQNVFDLIKDHPKLTSLRKILDTTDIPKRLKSDGHYTIFAPIDEAFDKLEPSTKQKLLKGDSCASSILQHLITSHTVCSCAIIGNVTTHNVAGEILNLERTADDQLIVEEKSKIIETDLMATNGVVHLIDTILIPDSALHINDALKNENLTKFHQLIQQAGLVDEIDSLENSTLFAPSNEALEKPEAVKILDSIKDNKDKLRDLILYHTVAGELQSCDMNNNAMMQTNDNGQELRLNLYSTLPVFTNIINRATINCARITGFDEKSCGSVIHEVDKLLVPPSDNILELIKNDPKYSTLIKLLKDTEVEKYLQQSNNSVTFLAPTDETFAAIDEADLKTLLENKEKAEGVLKNHVLTEVLCCSGVGPQSWGFNSLVPTLSKQHHQIGRSGSHQIRIGRAVVTSCDNLATNGVVHTVNKVLFPQRHHAPNFGGFFLFDF